MSTSRRAILNPCFPAPFAISRLKWLAFLLSSFYPLLLIKRRKRSNQPVIDRAANPIEVVIAHIGVGEGKLQLRQTPIHILEYWKPSTWKEKGEERAASPLAPRYPILVAKAMITLVSGTPSRSRRQHRQLRGSGNSFSKVHKAGILSRCEFHLVYILSLFLFY